LSKTTEQARLATLLDAALTYEGDALARQVQWRVRVRAILSGKPRASLNDQRSDLKADMRELLRAALDDPSIRDTNWFFRRAERALCQDDGIIKSGEDYILQIRVKTETGWSSWETLEEQQPFKWSKTAVGQIRHAPSGRPFEEWQPKC
jgi:hypothetical protein